MRKWGLVLCLIMIPLVVFGADLKSNVYQITTYVDSITTARNVLFPATGERDPSKRFESRDLTVQNIISNADVWLDVSNINTTSCQLGVAGCFVLASGSTITFRNYRTSGISVIRKDADNSGITVISVY